jgi:hypothetical protein
MVKAVEAMKKLFKNEKGFGFHFVLPLLVIAGVVVIGVYLAIEGHADPSASQVAISTTTVTVNTNKVITTIPSRYEGLSFEASALCNLTKTWNTPSFQQLIENLGPQVMRIGGNSSSSALWDPTGTDLCTSTKTVLNEPLVDDFFSLAKTLDTKVMWTLNLGNYAPTTYSNEAAYVVNTGQKVGGNQGSYLWALGMGNEPDLFHTTQNSNGGLLRPADWPLEGSTANGSFISAWNSYRDAIRQSTGDPNLKFMGPDIADNDSWFTTFINDEQSSLSYTTHHYYAIHTNNPPYAVANVLHTISACKNVNASSAQDLIAQCYSAALLSSALMTEAGSSVSDWAHDSGSVPLAIDEANSVTGGAVGSSNTFASTLWGLDYLYTALANGAKQVNFHDTAGSAYTPIAFSDSGQAIAQPLYYAMLAFHFAAAAGNLVVTTVSSPYNITAHGVYDDGKLDVTLINKDSHSTTVDIMPNKSYSFASSLLLSAPSLNSTAGTVTFGGQTTATDGTLMAKPISLKALNGKWSINLSADSAKIISFAP